MAIHVGRLERSNHQVKPLNSTEYIRATGDLFVPLFPNALGNAVSHQIISHGGEAVLLDFGHNRTQVTRNYPKHPPSRHEGIAPLINWNIFPASLQSLLRDDLPNQPEREKIYQRFYEREGEDKATVYARNLHFQSEVATTAIAATHAHADHVGNIAAVTDALEIVTTPETYALLLASQQQAKSSWYAETVEIRDDKKKLKKTGRTFIDLKPGEDHSVNEDQDYLLRMIPSSHWFGSAAIEVTLPSGNRVLHTGDLNWGSETEKLASYIYAQEPYDLMFLDATHFGNPYTVYDESEIRLELRDRFREGGPIYMMVNEMDMTRISGIINAAQTTNRQVYAHPVIAKQLSHLRSILGTRHRGLPDPKDMRILIPPGTQKRISDDAFHFSTYQALEKHQHNFPNYYNGKRDVFILSRPEQLMNLDHHGALDWGNNGHRNRLIVSTYGYNPATNGKQRYLHLQDVIKQLRLDVEYLSGHHMRSKRFTDLLRYISAETVVLFHTDPKYEAALKDYVLSHARKVKRVISNADIDPETPMTFDGRKLAVRSHYIQLGMP